jgi:putative transposase
MNASTPPYTCHRYPAEIISHAVWLYFRFALSFRDIEELLAALSVRLSFLTIRATLCY